MPNWCECELRVCGDAKRLKEFKLFGQNRGNVLDTNKFVRYPERYAVSDKIASEFKGDFKDRPKDGFNNGGYGWCLDNWGTKWGICDAELVEDYEGELNYEFSCAWSPCSPVVLAMSKLFPDLEFTLRYFEGGAGFNGIYSCEDGVVTDDKSGDYFGSRGG